MKLEPSVKYQFSDPDFVRMLAGEWAFPDRSHYDQKQVFVEKALARKDPSAKQLNYLEVLGYRGPTPTSMAECSKLIEIWKAK